MKYLSLIVILISSLSLALQNVSCDLIDVANATNEVLQESGLTNLGPDTVDQLLALGIEIVENGPPELQEQYSIVKNSEKASDEDMKKFLELFREEAKSKRPIYQPRVRTIVKDIPRQVFVTIKIKIKALWIKIKNIFKKVYHKIFKPNEESAVQKRSITLLTIGVIIVSLLLGYFVIDPLFDAYIIPWLLKGSVDHY